MVKYRKAFRSSIRDALSAEKVRERERKKLWNSSPDRIRKGNQSIKKLNKSDEEREFREKRNQTTTYHSLLSQSLLVRLPHFLALGANRIRVGRAMLHGFRCLFFLSQKRCFETTKKSRKSMAENEALQTKVVLGCVSSVKKNTRGRGRIAAAASLLLWGSVAS
jgi:hypothetical protein